MTAGDGPTVAFTAEAPSFVMVFAATVLTAVFDALGFAAFFVVLAVVAMDPTSPSRTKKAAIGGGLYPPRDKASRDVLSMDALGLRE